MTKLGLATAVSVPKLLGAVVIIASGGVAYTSEKNGFDPSGSLVRPIEIREGGPPRDGIPPLD